MADKNNMTPTEKMLLDQFDGAFRLNAHQMAKVLGLGGRSSVINAIYRETFPIPTEKTGRDRTADVRDVAAYLDRLRDQAKEAS